MIILPERGVLRYKYLVPVAEHEWRTPSQSRPRDEFGNEIIHVRFYVAARLDDGHIVWKGWFDSREDFDQFLFQMEIDTLRWDRATQRLPTPWFDPDLLDREGLHWIYATTRSLTGTSASNQTDTVPSDWNSSNNFIDTIASGASGGSYNVVDYGAATGGGGGAWSRQTNVSLTPGGSATYRLSAGGSAVTAGLNSSTNGNAGADCWYNGSSLAGASVGSKGGNAGQTAANGVTASSASGGASGAGVGSSKFSGGASGTALANIAVEAASGGGGAAGPSGAGSASSNATNTATSGGAGNNGGTSGGAGSTTGNATAGSNGTHYGSVGAGGGGGGCATDGPASGGQGGLYGAGGGGCSNLNSGGPTSGQGRQALIWQDYTPARTLPVFRRSTRFFTRSF